MWDEGGWEEWRVCPGDAYWARERERERRLDIHQGEDFSTWALPLIRPDRSSGPVFVTVRTPDHLWRKHASLQLLPDTSALRAQNPLLGLTAEESTDCRPVFLFHSFQTLLSCFMHDTNDVIILHSCYQQTNVCPFSEHSQTSSPPGAP